MAREISKTALRRKSFVKIVLLVLFGVLLVGDYIFRSMSSKSDLIAIGQFAPEFTASTADGSVVDLNSQRGKNRVVLVFYPGDYTPVCTAQLCSFRDAWSGLQEQNAVVFGINPADKAKHAGFSAAYHLPFPLIVDTNGIIAEKYGCRAAFGIIKRTVYIVGKDGKVIWVKRGNPPPSEILRALRGETENGV